LVCELRVLLNDRARNCNPGAGNRGATFLKENGQGIHKLRIPGYLKAPNLTQLCFASEREPSIDRTDVTQQRTLCQVRMLPVPWVKINRFSAARQSTLAEPPIEPIRRFYPEAESQLGGRRQQAL
jgi:hypothetical protein